MVRHWETGNSKMPQIVYTYRRNYGPQGNRPNLLVRLAAGLVSVLALVASAFLGLFIFLAVLGILAVAGTVVAVRFWLFRRRVEAALEKEAASDVHDRGYIDADYEER